MITVKLDIDVSEERRVMIQLPPEVSSGRHEILVIVDESAMHRGRAGSLQQYAGKINWPGDGLEFQSRSREEWE